MRFWFVLFAQVAGLAAPTGVAGLAGCSEQTRAAGPRYSDDAQAASHRLGLPLGDDGLEEAAAALDPGDAWIKPVGPRAGGRGGSQAGDSSNPRAGVVASTRAKSDRATGSSQRSGEVTAADAAAPGGADSDAVAGDAAGDTGRTEGEREAGRSKSASSKPGKSSKASSKKKRLDNDAGDDHSSSESNRSEGASSDDSQQASGSWTILLSSFTGPDHELQARRALAQYQAAIPDLADAFITENARGSMVAYGSYSAPKDAAAQADLQRFKALVVGRSRPFARALMSPLTSGAERRQSRFDLMRVRDEHPEVNPLYTLQVAVWGDFDSGTLSDAEIRRRAEEYAGKLRGQGVEAYVYHNDLAKLSMVTVGVFDSSAIDAEAGLTSPELAALRKQFPAHLVNGEEFHEPVSARMPNRGTRLQEPRLVEVPMR